MKRSEAVRQIAIQMELANGRIVQNPTHYWLKYAECALNTMEQLGMLLPKISDGQVDDWGNEISGPEYQWEDEQ